MMALTTSSRPALAYAEKVKVEKPHLISSHILYWDPFSSFFLSRPTGIPEGEGRWGVVVAPRWSGKVYKFFQVGPRVFDRSVEMAGFASIGFVRSYRCSFEIHCGISDREI